MTTTESKLNYIFEHFGALTQRNKICEEFREFQDELYEIYVKGGDNENLLSEVADMLILILQFAYDYGYSNEEIAQKVKEKIERTLKRIEEDYYE